MMIIPINWSFQRKNIMPFLEAKCENSILLSQNIIIKSAVDIIESAQKFNGVPFSSPPTFQSKSAIAVSFSLIFSSETDFNNFWKFIHTKN